MKQQLIDLIKKNKIYAAIIFIFLIYMLFFDEFNWIRISRDKHKMKYLQKERVMLESKIEADKKTLKILRSDPNALERLAREQYYLKKENEEVYVIVEEE
jgi:cell division protein DivIC